ncbi:G-protein coupled receptor [Fagus crenata]
MTQLGFEKSHRDFSFRTEQVHVALYMTAIASISNLVQKPIIKVLYSCSFVVRLRATGKPPTTLSPTVLIVDWRCLKVRDTPYEVNITIPVEGYEPIQFILTKLCEYRHDQREDTTRGWAIFGVTSCIGFLVFSTLFRCVGFIYKTRVERLHGIDALPGMTIVSACLETVSGVGQGYSRAEDRNSAFANEAYWERPPVNAQGAGRPSERKYGSI